MVWIFGAAAGGGPGTSVVVGTVPAVAVCSAGVTDRPTAGPTAGPIDQPAETSIVAYTGNAPGDTSRGGPAAGGSVGSMERTPGGSDAKCGHLDTGPRVGGRQYRPAVRCEEVINHRLAPHQLHPQPDRTR